ncbi:hypothetical protein ES703_14774 [subsurface metagenome]
MHARKVLYIYLNEFDMGFVSMRSFIKIYGPPVLETIKTLEKIAVDMPEVSIMDTLILNSVPKFMEADYTMNYFSAIPAEIEYKRCSNIISKSGEMLGEYDFFFEWFTEPSMEQLNSLIKKIDEALAALGCKYSITTKN